MRNAIPLGAVLGLFGIVAVQPAAAAPQSSPVVGLSAAAQSIAAAPDGSMWASESASPGRIAKIAADGTVTEYVGGSSSDFSAGASPGGITVTPDGYVWFLMHAGSEEVDGLSVATGKLQKYVLSTGTPTSLAAGADGKLWMTATGDAGTSSFIASYARVTDSSGTTNAFKVPFTTPTPLRSLAPGGDGALWFVEDTTAGRVGRITTDGTVTWRDLAGAPSTLAAGPGGVWFARGTDLGVITADTNTLFAGSTQPAGIAAGPDGAMWTTTVGGVVRVTADGAATTYSAGLDAAAQGTALAAGADGRMWMTLDRAPYLVRITVPPLVGTATVSAASATTGSVTVAVKPNGLATTAQLQLRGVTGAWTTISQTAVGDGLVSTPVKFDVSGLTAGATSSLRVVASNDAGQEISTTADVTTPAASLATPEPTPAPTPTPTPSPTPTSGVHEPQATTPSATPQPTPAPTPAQATPTAAPAPVQGSTVVVSPTRGTVTYRVPGSTVARPVDGTASIPTGSIIDTTSGSVALSSRVNGADQLGTFYGGEFKVKQVKATGMTQLYLTGKLDCPAAGAASASAARAATKGTKRRHVWGSDNHGQFQTHGQDSVATVRGTEWLTTDTCAGTVVKVFKGAVSVAPRTGKGKAVLVKAGGRQFTPHAG